MEIFPFTITAGQFLGDDVVIAGNDITSRKSPTCQVKIVDFASQQMGGLIDGTVTTDNKQRNMVRGEASLRGNCGAMELCGVPSLSKNYAAVAVNEGEKGFVSILEVQASQDHGGYRMAPVQSFEHKEDEETHFNSLAYHSYHSHLAAATEAGVVVITDIANAGDVTRKMIDHAGALVVRYTQAGMVVTLGQSNAGQVLLWDPRTSSSSSNSDAFFRYQRPLVNTSRGFGVSDKDSYLTCLETHPSNEYEFYCGTSTGSVVIWDIRKSDTSDLGSVMEVERSRHYNDQEVTALAFRGAGRSPYVLSGATDGSVTCVNYLEKQHNESSLRTDMGGNYPPGELDIGFDQGTSAITSIQCHPQTDKILVTSKLGEVNLI